MSEINRSYGSSTGLFVTRKAGGESLILGGNAEDASRWIRVLSFRAAQMLWFHLTQFLFPEKSDMVTAMVMTAPLRSADLPTITTHMTVDKLDEGGYEVVGMIGNQTWDIKLADHEAQKLWTALDIALYPVGWQGDNNRPSS